MENNELNQTNMPEKKADQQNTDIKSSVLLHLHDLVCLMAGVMLLLLLVFRISIVSGPSMNDTLVDGDYLLLLSNVFYTEPKQGDIIVATKEDFKNGEPIIKRIIATEGQTVDIDFESGIVTVDGVALEEPYTLTATTREEGVVFPLVVDEGCIFVMGDNRDISKDSRDPEIGQIDTRQILGKAILLMYPGNNDGFSERDFARIGVLS